MNGQDTGAASDYDLVLVAKIMSTVWQYSQEEALSLNVTVLRNTMLAVAAHLHLRYAEACGPLNETFAEAADKQLHLICAFDASRLHRPC